MSAVDDIRKLLQDMVTPDLKALETRVDALEAKMELRFNHLDEKIDARFKHSEEKMDLKFDLMAATMAANQSAIMRVLDLDRRMERLEAENASAKALNRPS